MSGIGSDVSARRARAGHADEETRYRAVGELDPRDAGDRLVLLARLGDPSWRVRSAAVERLASRPDPGAVPGLVELLAAGPGVRARDGGWLLLGHSESLINVTADFEIVQLEADLVYRKPVRDASTGGPQ